MIISKTVVDEICARKMSKLAEVMKDELERDIIVKYEFTLEEQISCLRNYLMGLLGSIVDVNKVEFIIEEEKEQTTGQYTVIYSHGGLVLKKYVTLDPTKDPFPQILNNYQIHPGNIWFLFEGWAKEV